MAPVARELAAFAGILEPLQREHTVQGQVQELARALETNGTTPLIVVGYSWGAWLSMLCAADHPALIRKLILVSSGSFDATMSGALEQTRMGRLTGSEQRELLRLNRLLEGPATEESRKAFGRLGQIFERADAFDPDPAVGGNEEASFDIFRAVWREGAELRRTGELLSRSAAVRCPVVAIHGEADPHPVEGVRMPLSSVIADFRLVLLERCGHKPWIERQARESFFACLRAELMEAGQARNAPQVRRPD